MTERELLDVVDTNDIVIGQLDRSEVYARNLGFRVINAFLINDRNLVWIPRRSAHKKLFPSCLDTSVGGHVMAGESYEQAFFRELMEELTLDATVVPYELIAKLHPSQGVSAHMQLYLIRTNETPSYNSNDFSESYWFNFDELFIRIQQGEPTKGDLPKLLEVLQEVLRKTS